MDADFAKRFVTAWETAWNSHDLEAVLSHFHDQAIFASPIAQQVLPDCDGVLYGKERIREYWSRAFSLIPTLHFDVERYFVGVNAIVIQYRNQAGNVVDEVLLFDERLVVHGFGTYIANSVNPTGLTVKEAS